MSDYNSSLQVRTENAGDVEIKLVDGLVPAQKLTVNVDGSLNITDNGASLTVDASDLDIRNLAFADDKVDVSGSLIDIQATDLDIRDLTFADDKVDASGSVVQVSDGNDGLAINSDGSINVKITDASAGTDIHEYSTATVASGASSNHDYTAVGEFHLTHVEASGSGKMKIEIQVNAVTKYVLFNSTATPNMSIKLSQPLVASVGQVVRVIRTNRDNQSQDVYSTISGFSI